MASSLLNKPVFPEAFSIFNPLLRRHFKNLVSCNRDRDVSGSISANYSGDDGQKVSEWEKKKPSAGRELLWRANSEELPHELGEIIKGGGQFESLIEVFPSSQGRAPHSAAVQNMREAPFDMHAAPA